MTWIRLRDLWAEKRAIAVENWISREIARRVDQAVQERLDPFRRDLVSIRRRVTAQEEINRYQEVDIVNISEYAQAVDAETNRIADALEDLKQQLANDGAADQAELDAAFGPVLERLRGVGVEGETAPPAEEEPVTEPAPEDPAPADGSDPDAA